MAAPSSASLRPSECPDRPATAQEAVGGSARTARPPRRDGYSILQRATSRVPAYYA